MLISSSDLDYSSVIRSTDQKLLRIVAAQSVYGFAFAAIIVVAIGFTLRCVARLTAIGYRDVVAIQKELQSLAGIEYLTGQISAVTRSLVVVAIGMMILLIAALATKAAIVFDSTGA